jgi:adenylate cyclase
MAELVQRLGGQYQAQVVGLDIVFPEASQTDADQRLVQAVQHTPTVLSVVWDFAGQHPPLAVGALAAGAVSPLGMVEAQGYLANFSALAQSSLFGHISPVPDARGVIRFMPPIVDWQGQGYPMLALSMLATAESRGLHPTLSQECLYPFAGRALKLCLNGNGMWPIPYRHADSAFTVIPAWQVLTATVPIALLQHKKVIVGASAMGLSDRVATPLAPVVPGMMVHAQILASLGESWGGQAVSGPALFWFLPVALVGLGYALVKRGVLLGVVWSLCVSVVWLGWVGVDYRSGGVLPDIALPVFALLLWLVMQALLEWALVRRQSARLYNLFKDYLPNNVLQQLVKSPDEALLLPRQREVTVLFADIVGFTTMTEQMRTQDAAQLTRQILSLLTQAVHDSQGTLDKYMGDALMAFWNAPLDQPTHRAQAIAAALKMRAAIAQLNQQRKKQGLAPIRVRIGINTGEVLVGDLGTQWRHAYTVLGDAVNVAQRLMVVAAQLGEDVVVGEHAAEEVTGLSCLGEVFVPGREKREVIFVIPITDI